jgi:hypothetical protein
MLVFLSSTSFISLSISHLNRITAVVAFHWWCWSLRRIWFLVISLKGSPGFINISRVSNYLFTVILHELQWFLYRRGFSWTFRIFSSRQMSKSWAIAYSSAESTLRVTLLHLIDDQWTMLTRSESDSARQIT